MNNLDNLDLFADMLEPMSEILTDAEVRMLAQTEGNRVKAVATAIKKHKPAVVQLLALADGVGVDEYEVPPPPQLLVKIVEIVNRPQFKELFTLQGQTSDAAFSGSATANI